MAMQGVYQSRASAGLQSLPAGYMEAATAPGRHLAAGISKFGESMGEAIESYKKGKAQGEYLDKEFELLQEDLDEMTGGRTENYESPFGASAGLDESRMADISKDIAKFSELGLSQKKAKIADLKFDIDRFYKERDFNQKKSQFDQQFEKQSEQFNQQFEKQSEQFDQQFNLQREAHDLRESQFGETLRSNKVKEQQATDDFRLEEEAQQLKANTPTMGQNVAAARQLFREGARRAETYRGGVDPATGLPVDLRQLKTEALRLHGHSKEDVDGINEAYDEQFGAAEPKVGDVIEREGQKFIRTSKGQIQALPGQEAGDSISSGLLDATGDSLTRWLGGSDADFHEGARAIAEKDRKLLPEFYALRQEANKAYRQDKMANLPAADVQRINTQERMIRIWSDQLATAEADEVPGLQKQISDAEKSIKAVVDKHVKRQGKLQDAARGGGGTGMPTSVYTPGGKFKKVK